MPKTLMIAPDAPKEPTDNEARNTDGISKEKNDEITAEFKYMVRKLAGPKNPQSDDPNE